MTYAGRCKRAVEHLYIAGSILLTVYGQLVLKWQVASAGALPAAAADRIGFLVRLVLSPWVLSGLAAAFLAFLCWAMALTKFQLSYAYPFMSLAFALVLLLSALLFREELTLPKILGMLLIVLGITIGSRG
jgi:multidrug transporter EmrE-like cation transporter